MTLEDGGNFQRRVRAPEVPLRWLAEQGQGGVEAGRTVFAERPLAHAVHRHTARTPTARRAELRGRACSSPFRCQFWPGPKACCASRSRRRRVSNTYFSCIYGTNAMVGPSSSTAGRFDSVWHFSWPADFRSCCCRRRFQAGPGDEQVVTSRVKNEFGPKSANQTETFGKA